MKGLALAPSVRLQRGPFLGAVLAVTMPCAWSPVLDTPILLRSVDGGDIIPLSALAALAHWSLARVANAGLLPPSAPDARDQWAAPAVLVAIDGGATGLAVAVWPSPARERCGTTHLPPARFDGGSAPAHRT